MTGRYNINETPFYLQTICATKVAQQVLIASGITLRKISLYRPTSIEDDAMRRTSELELTQGTRQIVESLLVPMQRILGSWYRDVYSLGHPVLTPHGIVDKDQSVTAILTNEQLDKSERFRIACEQCRQEYIFKVFDEPTFQDPASLFRRQIEKLSSLFVIYWMNVYSGQYGQLLDHYNLPQQAYNEGFWLAWNQKNELGMRHFLNKASFKSTSNIDSTISFGNLFYGMSPTTFYSLCVKLVKDGQSIPLETHSKIHLIDILLKWPYNCFFIEEARSQTKQFGELWYWHRMLDLAHLIVIYSRDLTYRNIFIEYCKMGRSNVLSHDSYKIVSSTLLKIIYDLLMLRDEWLINVMLIEMQTELKDDLLMSYFQSTFLLIIKLICRKEFRLIELFIRGCSMHKKHKLHEFKSKLQSEHPSHLETIVSSHYCDLGRFHFSDEWKADHQRLVKIVENILDEKQCADEIEQ